ncbi:MAG: BamA/TamA family outer membrane protein [Ignavibacteriales bacterium]|nr:BamA/TamA family outer membrane protein [Ignavibacteriales bacterium]
MWRSLVCIFVVLYQSTTIASDVFRIRSISFDGNKVFSDRELIRVMILKPSSQFSTLQFSKDIESILRLYQKSGFYFTEIKTDSIVYPAVNSEIDLNISIEEHDRVTIDSINITGNTVYSSEEILQQFDLKAGEILIPSILENDFDFLISQYEQNGYPFASISLRNVKLKSSDKPSKIGVDIFINEGPKITISEIKVVGNKITDKNVIVRETRLKMNEVYNHEKIRKIPDRLRRLNIFLKVDEPKLYSASGGSGLWIKVEEGNTNTFDGIIGYAPSQMEGERGIVTGMVNVTMRNLFGTARKLGVKWLRDERKSQEIGVQYLEPWVFNLPLNLGGAFNQRQQDTIYIKRVFELKADFLVTESFTLSGTFSRENIVPSSTTNLLSKSSTTIFGGDIHYDTRDDILNTTKGINYRSGYQVGRKNFSGQITTVQRISLDADFFVSTFQRQIVSLGLHGRNLSSSKIELADLYRFGGTNTLRGYRENQFLASRLAWTNTEYRLIIERRSYVFGFFDTGYYFLPGDDSKGISSTQKFKYGYGIGIRLETVLGNLGVSFAFGEGDSFLEGKIHIGLINEF